MNKIIVYGTHYGTTKKYALELARKTNIDAISYENLENINDYDTIIYLGGLYAGGILGMAKTLKKLNNVQNKNIIIVTVGVSDPTDKTNIKNIRNSLKNQLKIEVFEKAKIFHLRGGIDYAKLNFVHKTMLKLLYNKVKNLPKDKQTPEDKAMIETYNKKVDFINFLSLDKIIKEINKEGY